jgi:hypothetical protein
MASALSELIYAQVKLVELVEQVESMGGIGGSHDAMGEQDG